MKPGLLTSGRKTGLPHPWKRYRGESAATRHKRWQTQSHDAAARENAAIEREYTKGPRKQRTYTAKQRRAQAYVKKHGKIPKGMKF